MNEEQSLSAAQKAQSATRIGELDQQIAQRDTSIQTLQQQLAGAKGRKREPIETQLSALREERTALLQEANTLRAQLGMPLVIPAHTAQTYPVAATAAPVKKRGGFLRGCLIVVGGLVVLIVLFSYLNSGPKKSAASSGTTGSSTGSGAVGTVSSAVPATASYGLGQDVKVGDVRWKVLDAKDEGQTLKSTNQFIDPKKTAGKWVRVRMEIENQSKDPLSFTSVDLTDGQGRTFHSSSDASMFVPTDESCTLSQLSANVPKSCQAIFELPADAKNLKLVVGDLKPLGADDVPIDLGF